MMKTLIVTPTYDERENLAPFLDGVFAVVPDAHVLVVDDNSPDGTGALADRIAESDERVHVMHRPGKLGLGSAYLDAFGWALERDYDVVFEMDTDLSHDPRYLPDFLAAFEAGADLVIGSRNIPGGGVEGWGLGRHDEVAFGQPSALERSSHGRLRLLDRLCGSWSFISGLTHRQGLRRKL